MPRCSSAHVAVAVSPNFVANSALPNSKVRTQQANIDMDFDTVEPLKGDPYHRNDDQEDEKKHHCYDLFQ